MLVVSEGVIVLMQIDNTALISGSKLLHVVFMLSQDGTMSCISIKNKIKTCINRTICGTQYRTGTAGQFGIIHTNVLVSRYRLSIYSSLARTYVRTYICERYIITGIFFLCSFFYLLIFLTRCNFEKNKTKIGFTH